MPNHKSKYTVQPVTIKLVDDFEQHCDSILSFMQHELYCWQLSLYSGSKLVTSLLFVVCCFLLRTISSMCVSCKKQPGILLRLQRLCDADPEQMYLPYNKAFLYIPQGYSLTCHKARLQSTLPRSTKSVAPEPPHVQGGKCSYSCLTYVARWPRWSYFCRVPAMTHPGTTLAAQIPWSMVILTGALYV
jgi:hypothetical protein